MDSNLKFKLFNKKANAATFVFVMAAFILLYMVLLPQDVVEDVIDLNMDGQNNVNYDEYDDYNTYKSSSKKILIDDAPGPLSDDGRTDYEYQIPSVTIFRTTESSLMAEENPFIIKNGWFVTKFKVLEFEIEDGDLVNNFLLSYNAPRREGILNIKVNDVSVYEKKISVESPEPVKIPLNKLKEGTNKIEFSVSSVGLAFWAVNEMSFENINLYADLTDATRESTKSTVYIPKSQTNIEEADLKFVPECNIATTGSLKVKLNGFELSNTVPDCGSLNLIPIDPNLIKEGSNSLEFETSKGSYLVDRIKINTELREESSPTYYFYIDNDLWSDIKETKYIANLSMKFLIPEDHYIDLKVNVNNENFGIYEYNEEYSSGRIIIDEYNYTTEGYEEGNYFRVMDQLLRKGNNVIRLEPQDDVDIISIKLEVQKLRKSKNSNNDGDQDRFN